MTRGVDNHNPCNLEGNDPWQGKVGMDGPYIKFDTPENGIRAGCIDVLNKYIKDKLLTVQDILYKYAPPDDNNPTDKYIDFICQKVGIKKTEDCRLLNPQYLSSFIKACIAFENSNYAYPSHVIEGGVAAALYHFQLKPKT